jgi:hypothetical protein
MPGDPAWHVTCEQVAKNKFMAAKIKMLTLLQEIRGFADIANRHPQPRSPGLVLTQIRSRIIQAPLVRRKLSITLTEPDHLEIPHQVKINYVKPSPASASVRSAA